MKGDQSSYDVSAEGRVNIGLTQLRAIADLVKAAAHPDGLASVDPIGLGWLIESVYDTVRTGYEEMDKFDPSAVRSPDRPAGRRTHSHGRQE